MFFGVKHMIKYVFAVEEAFTFLPTCQVRAVRFYQSSSPLLLLLLLLLLASKGTASGRSQWALPDLNCKCQIAVGTAGPRLNCKYEIAVGTARRMGKL